MWGTLVPVLIGGLLTLAGGFIGPFFLQKQKDAAEHKKRRADKFEELVAAVYDFDHWVDCNRLRSVHGESLPETVSPFAKVQSISSVYFPKFDTAIGELNEASTEYFLWMANAGQKRILKNFDNLTDGFLDVYKPYAVKRDGLINELKKFAQAEFQ